MTYYYKIIGNNFGNFSYHIGLNSLAENNETFDPTPSCVKGGLYYTDAAHLNEFFMYGDKLCTVSIPEDATIVRLGSKWKADKIIIEKIEPLWTIETLEYFQANGCPWDEMTCAYAAGGGHLEVLKWVRANGCHWDERTCACAAEGGHLEVLKWAHDNGCPWSEQTCSHAAVGGHLEVLKWARENGCP